MDSVNHFQRRKLYEFGPFGEILRANGTWAASNPIRHSSKYWDSESYFGYRYYNPTSGRWIARDPITESGGSNLYGMVGIDPISRVDPVGLQGFITPPTAYEEAAALAGYKIPTPTVIPILYGEQTMRVVRGQAMPVVNPITGKVFPDPVNLARTKTANPIIVGQVEMGLSSTATQPGMFPTHHDIINTFKGASLTFDEASATLDPVNRWLLRIQGASQIATLGFLAAPFKGIKCHGKGLFAEIGVKPGYGFNPNIASAADGSSYIIYAFKNGQDEVVYVGRASGLGTPAEVLASRIAKGHDHYNQTLTSLSLDVQGSKLASQGAEEFFIQGYIELGAKLSNKADAAGFSTTARATKSLDKMDAFFIDLSSRPR